MQDLDSTDHNSIDPLSTPADRQVYEEGRQRALQMSDVDIAAVPVEDRRDNIYQFLTPDEIWALEGRLNNSLQEGKSSDTVCHDTTCSSSSKQ